MKKLLLIILFWVFSLYSFSAFAWETPSANFTLKQSENNTTLQYKGKTLYQWSHISKTNPFIWDEGCEVLFLKFSEITSFSKNNIEKQKAWESLWSEKQKACLKDNYLKTISIEKPINNRFYVIKRLGYEWIVDIFLFDSKTQKLHKKINGAIWMDSISRIEIGKAGIYIQYSGARWNSGWLVLINGSNNKGVSLFSNTDDTNFITMKSFELMSNKRVKIIYSQWDNGEELEKIITLK